MPEIMNDDIPKSIDYIAANENSEIGEDESLKILQDAYDAGKDYLEKSGNYTNSTNMEKTMQIAKEMILAINKGIDEKYDTSMTPLVDDGEYNLIEKHQIEFVKSK